MICANCEKPVSKAEAVIDHIVPLSRGGGHGEDNIQLVHRRCHHTPVKWYVQLLRAAKRRSGELLCMIGRHKWLPDGPISIDWRSKWEAYEVAKGKCDRPGCTAQADEIRRDYYW